MYEEDDDAGGEVDWIARVRGVGVPDGSEGWLAGSTVRGVWAAVEVGAMSTRRYKAPVGAGEVGERVALAQDVWAAARRLEEALWQAEYAGVEVKLAVRRVTEKWTRFGESEARELSVWKVGVEAEELTPARGVKEKEVA